MRRRWEQGLPALTRGCAILLILATPFIHFLRYHSYPLARLEVGLCLLVLAAVAIPLGAIAVTSQIIQTVALAGCLTFFADVQFHPPRNMLGLAVIFVALCGVLWLLREHAVRILTLTMSTVLLSSVLLPAASGHVAAEAPESSNNTRGTGPFVLHVVLDEQIGIEGLPADLAPPGFVEQLKAFFLNRGFVLFGRAYSEYSYTHRSISHLLNFLSGTYVEGLDAFGNELRWDLHKNAYFEHFKARGYAIRVYQPDYLNYCGGEVKSARCSTYYATSLQTLPNLPGPPQDKALVIAGMYLDGSSSYALVRTNYVKLRRRTPAMRALLPAWTWERNRVSALYGSDAIETVRRDVAQSHAGELVFAHILLPHYPYVYDRSCQPRPPRAWQDRQQRDNVPPKRINTPESRASKYAMYFAQMECTMRKIEELFDAIPAALKNDAIVIVQGDHGSRISLVEPRWRETPLSRADYLDGFSALFAVRAPDLPAAYDRRVVPIQCLLGALVRSDFHSLPAADACGASKVVFLAENELAPTFPMPFHAFDDAAPPGSHAVAGDSGQD